MCDVKGKKSDRLYDHLATLCLSSEYSDVTFCVGNERLFAHRIILASNEYFRALMGHYAESQVKEIELPVPASPFKTLLKYIYSDCIILCDMGFGEIIAILRLAHMYDFNELTASILFHLEQEISVDNVCEALEVSRELKLVSLSEACLMFLDGKASIFMLHETFENLSQESLCAILKRSTFVASEIQISEAIQAWSQKNCVDASDLHPVIFQERLPRLKIDQLLSIMLSGFMDNDLICNAIRAKNNSVLIQTSINLASDEQGAKLIVGHNGKELLNDNTTRYSDTDGFSFHRPTPNINEAITVDLGYKRLINHIRILLWDLDEEEAHKYCVEVSVDQLQWDRVVDHTQYFCRSWQHLYFPLMEVRYIRYFGSQFVIGEVFAVVSLQAFQMTTPIPYLHDQFVMPTGNVATKDRGAIVLTGKNRNGLIYSNSMMTDANRNEYSSHPFSGGEILIQLGQPYYIGSIRLQLRNAEDRSYRFYVQTSVDNVVWTMAVDMRNKDVHSSSQSVFKFTQRLVIFVKIIGTKCSIEEDKEFCCVRFECPAKPSDGSMTIGNKTINAIEESKSNDSC